MTVEEARKVIVAFLDQFIERGAASDVIRLRNRLRDDPHATVELASQLGASSVAADEVFEAMRCLFEAEPAVDEPSQPDLVELHSWTSREADGGTGDPAQWSDWLRVLGSLSDDDRE